MHSTFTGHPINNTKWLVNITRLKNHKLVLLFLLFEFFLYNMHINIIILDWEMHIWIKAMKQCKIVFALWKCNNGFPPFFLFKLVFTGRDVPREIHNSQFGIKRVKNWINICALSALLSTSVYMCILFISLYLFV